MNIRWVGDVRPGQANFGIAQIEGCIESRHQGGHTEAAGEDHVVSGWIASQVDAHEVGEVGVQLIDTDQAVLLIGEGVGARLVQLDRQSHAGIHLQGCIREGNFQKSKSPGTFGLAADAQIVDDQFRVRVACGIDKESVGVHAEDDVERHVRACFQRAFQINGSAQRLDLEIGGTTQAFLNVNVESSQLVGVLQRQLAAYIV